MNRRYVAITADIFAHPLFEGEPFSHRDAWIWLIANAAWKEHQVRVGGVLITLHRGQVIVGRSHLAETWGWTEKKVRHFLASCGASCMLKLGQSKGRFANVATICNYDKFQSVGSIQGPVQGPFDAQFGARSGATHYHSTKRTKGTPYSPPARDVGEEVRSTAPRKNQRCAFTETEIVDTDAAVTAFNEVAGAVGFTHCMALSGARRKALLFRLRDVGGLEAFKRAISAIPLDDFLSGRIPGRNGGPPFRLDIDRLLSTKSGLGDVLASLIDTAEANGRVEVSPEAIAEARRKARLNDILRRF